MNPAETDEPIEMLFVTNTLERVLHGVHIGATWRIRQNDLYGGGDGGGSILRGEPCDNGRTDREDSYGPEETCI